MDINLDRYDKRSAAAEFETDVCVVGSGPAGLTITKELRDSGLDVILVESGDWASVDAAQRLNGGAVVGGPYADLRNVRRRQVGGTVNLWNTEVAGLRAAKYLPFDPIDFEQRPLGPTGWPLRFADLQPWYRRAHQVCGLGPFNYDAREWIATDTGKAFPNLLDDRIVAKIYQFGLARHFLDEYPNVVVLGQNTTLIRNATVTELVVDASRNRLVGVRICSMNLRCVGMVRARAFVLATGAIENARLLLMSPVGSGPADWLGRCFMEHPRDYALTLIPKRDSFFSEAVFFDQHVAQDGTSIMGRLALTPEIQRKEGLLQASATLLPNHARPLPGTRMLKELLRATGLRRSGDYPVGRVRWSSRFEGEAGPRFVRVLLNLEQAPNPANRVVLGNRRDKFGMPLPELHWRWRGEEQRLLGRVRSIFAAALESAGRVQIFPAQTPDPNAHHHAGTTRMSHEARDGVIDPDCRVHGIENLFLAGASTFPTAGMANPTLTIVALALRLASHLRSELQS